MPTESLFTSVRNPYSHPNGMSILIDRNTQLRRARRDVITGMFFSN